MPEEEQRYVTVSIPRGVVVGIDRLMEELGYWPSRGAFVREACLEKIRLERRRLTRSPGEESKQSARAEAR